MAKESNFDKFFVMCSEDSSIECDESKKHKHCKLCHKACNTPYHCKRHFRQSHASRGVNYNGVTQYPCKLQHGINNNTDRIHYHCPVCKRTVKYRGPFQLHLKAHNLKKVSSDTKFQDHHGNDQAGAEGIDGKSNKKQTKHQGELASGADNDGKAAKAEEQLDRKDDNDGKDENDGKFGNGDESSQNIKKNTSEKRDCPICGKQMHAKSIGLQGNS